MHRSGTSCVGNLLTRLGVYFGDSAASTGAGPENPKGFFERRDVRDVCDTILQGSGCDWWAVNDFSPERVPSAVRAEANEKLTRVLEELEAHRPWFVKEPRLCLILPLLQHLQHQVPVFIHVWRRPLEVAQSLAVRNGFPLDFGLALWEAYVRAAFAASRGRPSLILSYNDLVSEPRAQTERLVNKLRDLGIRGLTMPEAAQIEDAVDANLHRNRSGAGELAELITPSQQRLLDALAAGEPGHPAFFESLSAVSQRRLADWTAREGVMLELRRAASDGKRAAANAAKLQAEIGARTRDIALLNDQVAQRAREKDASERELGEQRTRLRESDSERKLVTAALARRDEELADAKAALAQALEARKEAAEAVRALEE
jgi:hypothetical protein